MRNTDDTIVALATAPGESSIGVIRVSGNRSIPITNKIFRGDDLEEADTHTLHYGHIYDDEGNLIDEVMISLFHSPKSFTTEDIVEISCHGSPYIEQQIIQLLLNHGARLAERGEFTFRAFMHGRIDLSQAEAVADLIGAQNKASHDVALHQMRGGFSSEIQQLRDELIQFASLIELELDFGEEDVEFADREKLGTANGDQDSPTLNPSLKMEGKQLGFYAIYSKKTYSMDNKLQTVLR